MKANQRQTTDAVDETPDGTGGEPIIALDAMSKSFGSVVAADKISLSVEEGEYLTLLGPSGAGKTTLLHMISGFIEPTAGEIYIDDEPVSHKAPYERNIGLVFQDLALFPHMTVEENIAFPLKMRGSGRVDTEEKVRESLELVRLPQEYADKSVNTLSGGQKQRVAIARAIVYEPALLLLDEPLSSLDKKLRDEMRSELSRIHHETNLTIIHVTHNQTEALAMADRIAVLNDGNMAQFAPPQELYSDPKTPFVAQFIGTTTVLNGEVGPSTDEIQFGDLSSTTTVPDSIETGDEVIVAIRAEWIEIGDTLDTDNRYEVTVRHVEFEGDRTKYTVGTETGQKFDVVKPNDRGQTSYGRGDDVMIGWNRSDVAVYPASADDR